tara:strand:- start:151 stop:561 length:411 start_codon:yes stop_codon:yes gene_type:complete
MIDAFIYAFILLLRKNYFLKKMSLEMYMLFSSSVSMALMLIYFSVKHDNLITVKNIKGVKETLIPMIVVCIVSSLNWYLYNYLIKTTKLSKLIPLNELFIIIFSTMLGVLLLNENIKPINILGILGGIMSIYFINL